ncbi:MAG: hypothetical protein EXQ89_08260 [Rhodospirillaceae bacterium]|nr:hypothetical protein [Rhodospirillaceae bacterium]
MTAPPPDQPPDRGKLSVGALGRAVLAVLPAFWVTFGLLSVLAQLIPSAAIRDAVLTAFAGDDLTHDDAPWLDSKRGTNQYDDCLVFSMPLLRTGDVVQDAVSPRIIHAWWTDDGRWLSECQTLHEIAAGTLPDEIAADAAPFHRYLHGSMVVASFLLPVFGVATMRTVLKATCYALLGFLVLRSLMEAVAVLRRPRDWRQRPRLANAGIGAVATVLALLYGLPYFGQSVAHGPSEIALFGFLIFCTYVNLATAPPFLFFAAILLFACLTSAFGFIFHPLPMGLAVLVGILSLQSRPGTRPRDFVQLLAAGGTVYTGGVAGCLLLKQVLAGLVFETPVWAPFFDQVFYRMTGETGFERDNLSQLAANLYVCLPNLGIGSSPVAMGIIGLSLGSLLAAQAAIAIIRGPRAPNLQIGGLALSALVIFGWYVVFRNHTIIHACWQVRLLAWPIATGPLAALLLYAAFRLEKPGPASERLSRP